MPASTLKDMDDLMKHGPGEEAPTAPPTPRIIPCTGCGGHGTRLQPVGLDRKGIGVLERVTCAACAGIRAVLAEVDRVNRRLDVLERTQPNSGEFDQAKGR